MNQPLAVFLMGPTASGKTAVAVELVQRLPLEIISVDSALVYRGMDIGTAKPTPAERATAAEAENASLKEQLEAAQAALAAAEERIADGETGTEDRVSNQRPPGWVPPEDRDTTATSELGKKIDAAAELIRLTGGARLWWMSTSVSRLG